MSYVICYPCPNVNGILTIGMGHGWVITTTHFYMGVFTYPSPYPSRCCLHTAIIEIKIPIPCCYVHNVCYSANSGTSKIRLLVSDLDVWLGGLIDKSFTSMQLYEISTTNSHGLSFSETTGRQADLEFLPWNFFCSSSTFRKMLTRV